MGNTMILEAMFEMKMRLEQEGISKFKRLIHIITYGPHDYYHSLFSWSYTALKPTRRNILTQPEVQITGSLTFISNFLPIVHRNWKDEWWRMHTCRHIQHRIITLQLFSTIIISNIINSSACYISHYLEEINDVCFRRRFIQTATAKGRLPDLLFTIAIIGYGLRIQLMLWKSYMQWMHSCKCKNAWKCRCIVSVLQSSMSFFRRGKQTSE